MAEMPSNYTEANFAVGEHRERKTIACAGCAHWLRFDERSQVVGADGKRLDVSIGYCRRHAPRIQLRGSLQMDPFPTTLCDDICGDFEAPDQFMRRASR